MKKIIFSLAASIIKFIIFYIFCLNANADTVNKKYETNEKGILAKKDFYNIDDMKDIKFDDQRSETLQKRNFIYNFLSSMRQRINDPLGVRKKKRQGQ